MQPLENIALYSWGSAVLAWMYRQLCVACHRSAGNANLGGCAYLLQVWCWERWPLGRPTLHGLPVSTLKCDAGSSVRIVCIIMLYALTCFPCSLQKWPYRDCRSVGLYVWKVVKNVKGNPQRRYKQYTDLLDVLTQHQVSTSRLVAFFQHVICQKSNYVRH